MKTLQSSQGHYSDVIMSAIASQITSVSIVYSTVCSGADQIKHRSSASLAFVRGSHRWPVNSSQNWPVTRKMLPFNDVIMTSEISDNIKAAVVVKQPRKMGWYALAIWIRSFTLLLLCCIIHQPGTYEMKHQRTQTFIHLASCKVSHHLLHGDFKYLLNNGLWTTLSKTMERMFVAL